MASSFTLLNAPPVMGVHLVGWRFEGRGLEGLSEERAVLLTNRCRVFRRTTSRSPGRSALPLPLRQPTLEGLDLPAVGLP